MIQLIRRLHVTTAKESQIGLALGVAAVTMGLMLWAIIWQANLIDYQRGLIRWMLNMHG